MDTKDIPANGPSDWQPITHKPTLAVLGKLQEECGELTSIVARATIQGLDEADPETEAVNRLALQDEIADVLAMIKLAAEKLKLDHGSIDARMSKKFIYKKIWIDALERQAQ